MVYLGVGNPTGLLLLRCALLAMVVWGTLQAVATVFNTADASMGLPHNDWGKDPCSIGEYRWPDYLPLMSTRFSPGPEFPATGWCLKKLDLSTL
ncbi:MAG TPA: hypothetical protein VFS35_07045, partial [Terrimicrobiaceae bacterium]|nr:hypothetical protein [Terrimicrobiaceae bacterium]